GILYALEPKRPKEETPSWLAFIAVDSADKAVTKIQQAGGKVLMAPMDIADNGRQALLQDPTGAVFAVWQGKKYAGAGVVNEPSAMCWNELITSDAARAGAFYRQAFGWTTEPWPGPEPYTLFKQGDTGAGGMIQATPEMHLTHPYWLVYFGVEDCDK